MKASAHLKYLRIAPRKVRLIADQVRGKDVLKARAILRFTIKKGSLPLLKLLNSAVASAARNFQADPANLFIAKLTVDEGPKLKRYRPRARGQAYPIHKKTSHVSIVLQELKEGAAVQKEAVKEKTPELPTEEKRETTQAKTQVPRLKEEQPKKIQERLRAAPKIFRRKAI